MSLIVFFFLALSLSVLLVDDTVLAEDAIPFTDRAGIKFVTVLINGVPIEFIFDTGANSVVLNNDALQRIGITQYSTAKKVQSYTAGGMVEGYILRLNSIQAGNILKNNYDIAYVPSSTANLLGASFFKDYNYYIDEDYGVIRLIPKGSVFFDSPAAQQPPTPAESPRSGSGRIEVEMDGKKFIFGKGWVEDK